MFQSCFNLSVHLKMEHVMLSPQSNLWLQKVFQIAHAMIVLVTIGEKIAWVSEKSTDFRKIPSLPTGSL